MTASKPKGWLNLYLVLLFLGGLPFIASGMFVALHDLPQGLIDISGGIAISLCSVLSRRGFQRGVSSGRAYAKAGDVIFALTTIVFTINLLHFEVTPKSAALMIASVIWSALWWWYLSKSAQVKHLSPGSSHKGVLLVAIMCAVLACLTAWAYARMQAVHAEIRVSQMRERIRLEAAAVEWEAAQAAAQKAEGTEEAAETYVQESKPEVRTQATQSAKPQRERKIDAGNLTFVLPAGWRYSIDSDGYYDIYAGDKRLAVLIAGLDVKDLTQINSISTYEKILAKAPGVKSYRLTRAPLYSKDRNVYMASFFDVRMDKEGDYVGGVFEIHQEYGEQGCMLFGMILNADDNRLTEFAESIVFK